MKHIFTTIKQFITKPLLVACALLAMSGNAWGKYSFTWNAKTAVGKGSGTAKVEIRTTEISCDKSQSTTGSTLVTATYTASGSIGNGGLVLSRYAKFTATPSTGYHFVGWYTNKDCTEGEQKANSYSTGSAKPSNNGTSNLGSYYAKFEINTYTVKFNSNGGSGSMSNQGFTYGAAQNLTANAFTKSGYVFLKWNTKADGTGTSYNDKASVKNLTSTQGGEITLYAIWGRLAAKSPSAGNVAFGDVTIENVSAWKAMSIEHYRAGTITLTQTGDAGDFFIGEDTTSTSECASFTSSSTLSTKTIQVQFRPTANGLRTCTLTVSSNVNNVPSVIYYLKGEGYSNPTITWVDGNGNTLTSGETTLSAGDVLRATCISGQTITYSDYNTSYFTAGTDDEGNPILTVREDITGTIKDVTVKGNLAKNTTTHYNPYSETFTLNITNLIPQKIIWNDEISDLVNENMPYTKTLNAVAKNAKTGENSGQAITYSMEANEYMSLSGNVLTVKKVGGPVTITASAAESETYAPAELKRKATVIDIKSPCAEKDTTYDDFILSNLNIVGVTISPTLPKQLFFKVKRGGVGSLATKPDLVITQYNSSGDKIGNKETKTYSEIGSDTKSYTIDCDVNATSIVFSMSSIALITYEISDIQTTRVTSCTPNQTSIEYETEPGQTLSKNLKLSYCNALVFLSLKSDEEAEHVGTSKWSLNTTRLGACGSRGEQFVSVSFLSNVKGDYSDVLYIRDNVGNLLSAVNLTASVTVRPQHLDTWNIESTYNTTDQTTLAASTEEGRSNFDFTVKSSTPEGIVSISDAGVMTFSGAGTAEIVAHESGGGIYDEFTSEPYTITINKVTPTISANPAATVTYNSTLANNQLSGGGATVTLRGVDNTPVEGSFVWKNAGQKVSDKAGENYEYPVVFKPSDDAMYNDVEGIALVTVNRADGALAMNDGEVEVSVTGNQATLNLDELKESATDNGALSYEVTSANAAVSTNLFSASVAGEYTVKATKAQTDYYTSATADFTVVVKKRTPSVDLSALSSTAINYGEELSQASITGTVGVTNSTPAGSETASETCVWKDASATPSVGTATAKATFTSVTGWYNAIEVDVPITVNPIDASYAATATVYAGQSLSEVELTNATTGLGGEAVSGSVTWKNDVTAISFDEDGTQTLPIVFTSSNANYNSGEGMCIITVLPGVVFNGGEWTNGSSWSGGVVPTAGDRVIIDADVTISSPVEVTALTINAGKTVTIANNGVLTIGEGSSLSREEYGNIVVEAGGKLNLNEGELDVNDFTLYSIFEAQQPKSGQVNGQEQMTAHGDAYFILDIDANDLSYGWYKFTVPFHVDALRGITRYEDGGWKPITNEVNYAVMSYHEDVRAQGKYGWKKYKGILQPGVGYSITTDTTLTRYRFQKTAEATFATNMEKNLVASATGETTDIGWNSLGNGSMEYAHLTNAPANLVQMYNHESNSYSPVDLTEESYSFVVGAAFFVQAVENNSTLSMAAADEDDTMLRAPQRTSAYDNCRFSLSLKQDDKKLDLLVVSCDDEATSTYTRGKDVQKMGATTGTSVARLWVNAKGTDLCAVNTAYINDQAIVPLQVFAPRAGEYTLAINRIPNEDVYLRRNGVVIWNMAMGDYTSEFAAGTDNSYDLLVIRRVNNTATGVDQLNDEAKRGTDFVEKMIVNGQLFILRDGVLYDAQGKVVTL